MVSALAASATGLALTGCGSSSPGMQTDGGPDSMTKTDSMTMDGPSTDTSTDVKMTDVTTTDSGVCFPSFVLGLINNDTKSTASPMPIPSPCADNPPGTAQNNEFNSLF
jgi:hypothetical protein